MIYLLVVSLPSLLLRIGIIIMSAAAAITDPAFYLKGSLLSIVFVLGTEMQLNSKKNNKSYVIAANLFTLAIIVAATTMGAAPAAATTTTTAGATTMPQPVTATTDNQSVNVLISWVPSEIEPGQDTEFTLEFQDPSSGDSIPHVNYNFEIIDQNNGEPVESMTDLHTHSGSDEQTVTFDNPGSFNLVATIIGTGIDPPFDTTQSGTAQTIIPVGQQLLGAIEGNNTTAALTEETAATTRPTSNTTTTNTTSSSGLELSPQPIYQRRPSTTGVTPINQTHIGSAFSANGTLTLPNTTETINTTSNGSALTSLTTQSAIATETIMTEDGETVTATFYEIVEFPPGTGGANGIAIAVLHANSTGRLAPLNGMIVVGTDYMQPIGEGLTTYWEWIPSPPPSLSPATSMEESPPSRMNTITTTDATTTADTNATTATEEEQQQTTTTIPAPLLE